jgi:hypothetical protein
MSELLFKEVAMDRATSLLETFTETVDPITGQYDSVHLWGPPGIGKSNVVEQLGQRKNRKVMLFHAALRETVDLRGIPVSDLLTNTTRWLVPDELPRIDRDGAEGYFFCDEVNQAPQQMQAVLGGLILDGRIGDYRLPKGWRVIAAGNRVSDRAAAQRMPTHMRNRFAHLYCIPNVPAFTKWAVANNVAPEVIAFVRFRPALIHRMPKGDENAFPTPRSITKAAKYINAPLDQREDLFGAHIGADVARELEGFIRLYHSLGSLDDIIKNPTTAKVPTEPSERYAVATGLAHMATRKNWPAIVQYADRLTGEGKSLLIHDSVIRNPNLKNTTEYSTWAVKNQANILQS